MDSQEYGRLRAVGETVVVVTAVVGAMTGVGVRSLAGRLAGRRPPPVSCEAACLIVAVLAQVAPTATGVFATTVFGWWCVCLSAVDLLVRRLPNVLTVGGAGSILATAAVTGHGREAMVGAVLLAAPLCVTHLALPRSLGAGDVKLAVGLGAVAGIAGPAALLVSALLPSVLTAGAATFTRVARARRRSENCGVVLLPHGPSMCLATGVALITAG
ncbi:A24 family peptidase [Rhodococcus sp. NPDC047139]|uniref:A24 family peptidase n=1 Tax=Rhodococcus sp. NPDC047139 TaxID=3155141 RepID=UPI00340593F6